MKQKFSGKKSKQTNKSHKKHLHKLWEARGLRTAARFGSVDGILDEAAIAEQDSLQQYISQWFPSLSASDDISDKIPLTYFAIVFF